MFDLLPTGPSNLLDMGDTVVDINGYKPVDMKTSGPGRVRGDQSLFETFQRVRSRVEQLQCTGVHRGPPSKIMIQSQVRLYR